MKKIIIVLMLSLACIACIALGGCFSALQYESAGEVDGFNVFTNKYKKEAFVGFFFWDGDKNNMEFTVPDTHNGCNVTQLGGYHGSGGISAFSLNMPDVYDGRESVYFYRNIPEEVTEENSEELIFTVNIGKNVKTLERGFFTSVVSYGEFSTKTIEKYYIIKLYFNCAVGNPTFYSRGGVLYYKSNDQKAEFKY